MADTTTTIEQLYVAYFSRPADPGGVNFWNGVLANDPNGMAQITAAFAGSQEYKDTYANMDNTAVVQAVYHNLFGRDGDAAGVTFWVNAMNNHQMTIDNVVTQVAAGAQGNDKVVYNGRVSVATQFTLHIDQPNEVAAYSGTTANNMAKAFIQSIVDLQSGAAAIDPGVIDQKIAEIVGSHTGSVDTAHFMA